MRSGYNLSAPNYLHRTVAPAKAGATSGSCPAPSPGDPSLRRDAACFWPDREPIATRDVLTDMTPPKTSCHLAEVKLRVGKRGRFRARIEIGSGGLLAIGALVSSILLSSAAIVIAAKRVPHQP